MENQDNKLKQDNTQEYDVDRIIKDMKENPHKYASFKWRDPYEEMCDYIRQCEIRNSYNENILRNR